MGCGNRSNIPPLGRTGTPSPMPTTTAAARQASAYPLLGEGGPRSGGCGMAAEPTFGKSLTEPPHIRSRPAFHIRPRSARPPSPREKVDSIISTGMAGGMHRPPLTRGLAFAKQKTGGETRFSPSVFACGESTSLIRGRQAAAARPGMAKAF